MENYIIPPYQYKKGYIHLPLKLPIEKLPESILISNTVHPLLKKDSFHISLVCVKLIPEKFSAEQQEIVETKVLDIFNRYVEKDPILFLGFNNDFYFAKREDKESLVVTCKTTDLTDLFSKISQEINIEIEIPPTHITLYTLQKNIGIGINCKEELRNAQSVSSDELAMVWSVLDMVGKN